MMWYILFWLKGLGWGWGRGYCYISTPLRNIIMVFGAGEKVGWALQRFCSTLPFGFITRRIMNHNSTSSSKEISVTSEPCYVIAPSPLSLRGVDHNCDKEMPVITDSIKIIKLRLRGNIFLRKRCNHLCAALISSIILCTSKWIRRNMSYHKYELSQKHVWHHQMSCLKETQKHLPINDKRH